MSLRKPHRLHVVLLGAGFLLVGASVVSRLYHLQVAHGDFYADRARAHHVRTTTIQPERGDILDRNGEPLAQSTGRVSVYINPTFFGEQALGSRRVPLAEEIARETGKDVHEVLEAFGKGHTTALARRLAPEQANRLYGLLRAWDADSRGYWVHRESIRLYPRAVAAPVIGFCQRDPDGDNTGLAGVELAYDEHLRGSKITGQSTVTGISQVLDPWRPEDLLAARGNTLELTLDANLQEEVSAILHRTVEQFDADAGGAVILDVETGAVRAMASVPTFDNNAFSTAPAATRRNRPLTDPLETGSVVKLFTAAILLDRGYITPETLIDCENGHAVIDGRTLRDSAGHRMGLVPFREVLRWSSNVGIVKAAQILENREWHEALRDMGFGEPTGIDLPGEGGGIFYPVERWTKFSRTSLPMGYEIALTPLQTTAAIAALVNGGTYHQPYVVETMRSPDGRVVHRHDGGEGRQILRPTTSAIMREMMEDIVLHGTGDEAQVAGYRIGGKTGTTRKSDVFTHREYIASFGGAFPIHAPRLAVYLYIDNPQGEYYASKVAAPAFRELVEAAALHLGIPPTEQLAEAVDLVGYDRGRDEDAERLALVRSGMFGRMPNFHGRTIADVRRVLPRDIRRVQFHGTGRVADQFPAPGDAINGQTDMILHFRPETAESAGLMLAGGINGRGGPN